MAGLKPNEFNTITPTGTTEVYTQTGGVNGKFTLDDVKNYFNEFTETIVNLSSTEIKSLGTSPKATSLILGSGKYFMGTYELSYDLGNINYTYGAVNAVYLIGYTSSTYTGNPAADGILFIIDLSSIALSNNCAVYGTFPRVSTTISPSGLVTDGAMPTVPGTLSFIMTDDTLTPIDVADGTGTIKITLKTIEKTY